MVFFTCNACGQSVKKAQVEKHYMTQCRNCEVLSCMDCGKDFVGDAYKEHTKCVTEDEKYGGKNYKSPANKGNKGEAKQEQWLQRVRESKETAKMSPAISQLLDRIAEYPNVPRKKAKFENFVYNSMRVQNKSHVEQVWNIFSQAGVSYYKDLAKEEASKPNNNNNDSKQTTENSQTDSTSDQPQQTEISHSSESVEETDQSQVSKKKKKKKDKSKKHEDDTEEISSKKRKHQGDPQVPLSDNEDSRTQDKKNKKKHDTEQITEEPEMQVNGKSKKKLKKRHQDEDSERTPEKRKHEDEDDCTTQKMQRLNDSVVENGQDEGQNKKFKWNKIIISVLENCEDHQIPIKKLRKKVLNEYHACGGDVRIKSKEELRATFDKKVHKNPSCKVHKEIVKLVN